MSVTPSNPAPALERDPVCGMNVDPATAKHVYDHAGKTHYFCCAPCQEKFKAEPGKYLGQQPPAHPSSLVKPGSAPATECPHFYPNQEPQTKGAAYVCPMCPEVRENKPGACPSCGMALEADVPVASTRTDYTCPMHPQIARPGPGSCPICGMALERRTLTAATHNEENPELRDMTRRFWVSLALTAPLMAIAMASMIRPQAFMGGLAIVKGDRITVTPWALILPWLELAVGLGLIIGRGLRVSATVTSLLLLMFIGLLVRAKLKGMEISCGCFGASEPLTWWTVLRDSGMLAVSLLLTAMAFGRESKAA